MSSKESLFDNLYREFIGHFQSYISGHINTSSDTGLHDIFKVYFQVLSTQLLLESVLSMRVLSAIHDRGILDFLSRAILGRKVLSL